MMTVLTADRADVVRRTLDTLDHARRVEKHHARLPIVDLAVRDAGETGDGSYTITGHAATTNREYVLWENDWMRVRERIAPTAFNNVLGRSDLDVHLNINHDMRYAMARTGVKGIGGLELSMDDVGLRTFARVSPKITFVTDLAEQMRLGVVDQMSFAFTIADETRTAVENDDFYDVLYEINEVGNLYDVCVCARGANPQTDSSLRSLDAALGRDAIDASGQDHRSPSEGGQTPLVAAQPGGGTPTRVLIAQAQARSRSVRHRYPKAHTTP